MIWASLTIATYVILYESKFNKVSDILVTPMVIIQALYTVYTGYYELGAVRMVLGFIVNVVVMDVINYYWYIQMKNANLKNIIKRSR